MAMQQPVILSGRLVAASNTAGTIYIANNTGHKLRVDSAILSADSTLTVDETDYRTFTLKNGSDTIFTARATNAAGGGTLTAGTPATLALASTGVGAVLEVAQGACLNLVGAESGTGPACSVEVLVRCTPITPV